MDIENSRMMVGYSSFEEYKPKLNWWTFVKPVLFILSIAIFPAAVVNYYNSDDLDYDNPGTAIAFGTIFLALYLAYLAVQFFGMLKENDKMEHLLYEQLIEVPLYTKKFLDKYYNAYKNAKKVKHYHYFEQQELFNMTNSDGTHGTYWGTNRYTSTGVINENAQDMSMEYKSDLINPNSINAYIVSFSYCFRKESEEIKSNLVEDYRKFVEKQQQNRYEYSTIKEDSCFVGKIRPKKINHPIMIVTTPRKIYLSFLSYILWWIGMDIVYDWVMYKQLEQYFNINFVKIS